MGGVGLTPGCWLLEEDAFWGGDGRVPSLPGASPWHGSPKVAVNKQFSPGGRGSGSVPIGAALGLKPRKGGVGQREGRRHCRRGRGRRAGAGTPRGLDRGLGVCGEPGKAGAQGSTVAQSVI